MCLRPMGTCRDPSHLTRAMQRVLQSLSNAADVAGLECCSDDSGLHSSYFPSCAWRCRYAEDHVS